MASGFPFKIGGVALDGRSTLPALKYQGASVSVEAVDGSSTGRNQSGEMIRDLITQKLKWKLEFVPCTTAQLSALLNAINGASFTFVYPDPLGRPNPPTKFYVGSRSAPVWKVDRSNNAVGLWGNVSFDVIEM